MRATSTRRRRTSQALGLALVVALNVAGSCSTAEHSTGPTRDLATAQARWQRNRPDAYEVTVGRGCFCPPEAVRPVIVRVRGAAVESRRYADTGLPVPDNIAPAYPTVDELFAIIGRAQDEGAAKVDVQYHPWLGYPVSVYIDHSFMIADEEQSFAMRDLNPI